MSDTPFNLGRHEALISSLVAEQKEMVKSLRSIETTLAERRGERRAWIAVYGVVSGSVGAMLSMIARTKILHA